jgi:hypothetical protein
MAIGRPTALTPEVIEDVRRLLPVVLYVETVADYLGVDRTTVRKWLKRGAKEEKRLRRTPGAKANQKEILFREFFLVYKKGLAEGLFCDLATIKKASADQYGEDGQIIRKGEWQAAAWRAERRFPDLWGRRDKLEHSGIGGKSIPVSLEDLAAADREVREWETQHAEKGAAAEGQDPSADCRVA